jgi:hypothetical protein
MLQPTTEMPQQESKFANHPWDVAAATPLTRQSTLLCKPQVIDPGVNFFVLALEALGATLQFSCEGHPKGFYVLFAASYELALEIRNAGYFSVEVEGPGTWSIRKLSDEYSRAEYAEKDKAWLLRSAADAWLRHFGERLTARNEQARPFP